MRVEPGSVQTAGGLKLVFANQLRAVACLAVVLSHFGGVYVVMGPLVGWITSSPPVHVGHAAILKLTAWRWLNFGAFGVAVFFLISGFVIPFSLRARRAGSFLIARALRILPTFWAALLLQWAAVHAQSLHYGLAMAYSPGIYLENALLLDTAIGSGFVDLVNWTLAVEVKFYILMALLRPQILRARAAPLIGFALFAFVVIAAQRQGAIHLAATLVSEPMYIAFMLIGTLFHYHLHQRIRARTAIGAGAVLFGLFLLCWRIGPSRDVFPAIPINYLYALALFWAAYAARGRFRANRWLDFLAGVSFPLYLIHAILGYSALTFLILRFGLSYSLALLPAFALVLGLAWLLHRIVERPSQSLGRSISRSLSGARRLSASAPSH